MRHLRVTTLLLALILGGCETGPSERPALAPSMPMVDHAGRPPEATAALPVPVPRPKEKMQSIEPAKLVGLTQDEMRQLIGTPAAVREEPPAVVWSYGSAGCGLDIFFYLDLASQNFRALTYDLKPKGQRGLGGSACLASLRTSTP